MARELTPEVQAGSQGEFSLSLSTPLFIIGGLFWARSQLGPGTLMWIGPSDPGGHLERQTGEQSGL